MGLSADYNLYLRDLSGKVLDVMVASVPERRLAAVAPRPEAAAMPERQPDLRKRNSRTVNSRAERPHDPLKEA